MLQVISVIALIVIMMSMVSLGQRVLSQKKLTITILVVFFLYLIGQLYGTLFSRVPGSGSVIELSPFMSIVRLFSKPIEESGEVTGFFAWFMQGTLPGSGIILNILLFVPLGYLLSILIPKWKSKHNENTNGLIREYCPKSIDLESFDPAFFAAFTNKINLRPRKCLGWRSPFEVFFNQLLHLT